LVSFLSYNRTMKNDNWQVVGHEKNIKFLQKNIANNKLAHAYLFAGKPHLGKTLTAQKFMAAVLCRDYHRQNKIENKSEPCGQCVFCSQVNKGIYPDAYYLKKETDKKNISVEQVREIQKLLSLASFLNSYKIVLIEKAEDLSESSQNALLKIFEEPKGKTILILLASDYKLLLPTLVSRCQLIKFLPLADKLIFEHLIDLGASREQAKLLSALAHGQIGLAVDFYKNPDFFQAHQDRIRQFFNLFELNLVERFNFINELLGDAGNNAEMNKYLDEELDCWQQVLRDILLQHYGLDSMIASLNFKNEVVNLSQKYSAPRIISLLEQIKTAKKFLDYNINPRLAVENLLLNF